MILSDLGVKPPTVLQMHQIAELELHTGARVNQFEEKAAFVTLPDIYGSATPEPSDGSAIPVADVIDLTSKMRTDGTLDWTPPPGRWTVLRMGYSLTASPIILRRRSYRPEVDKLNAAT